MLLLAVAPRTNGATDPYAGIRTLLEERTGAVLSGDRAGFLATVDDADRSFVRRQRSLFDGFQELRLSSYRLDLDLERWPELTTAREVESYGPAADPRVLHVEERYAIAGYDDAPALDELYLTFVRRADGWRIAGDDDLEDVGLQSGRKLWELGPIGTVQSAHVLYVSAPGLREEGSAITDAVETALGRVDAGWPLRWDERVVVLAPRDDDALRRLIQATFDLDAFVAFVASSVDRRQGWRLVGDRVLLHRSTFSRYGASTREAILTHELAHLATREIAGPHIPAFVDEGVADWVAGDDAEALLAARIAAGDFDGRLPLDHEFVTGDDDEISAAYQSSTSAIRFASERFGAGAVPRFYELLGAVRREPGTWRYHVDRAMREVFGVGYRGFERRWARSVRERYA